jgi:NAD(P)-dependent dehydrogenase (short-subunit alcohol dehydrogenase family)
MADILEEQGRKECERFAAQGHDTAFHPLDLADPLSIDAFCAWVKATYGTVAGLVNNAAIATNVGGMGFEDIQIELWDRVHRVNVRGTWLITRGISPLLGEGGRIVNLASDTALWGAPKLLAYTTSKGAIIAMTRSLARELGDRKIGVTAIAPGIVRCEATEYVPAARHQLYETMRAVPGAQYPADIAGVVTFLLSEAALVLTGQLLTADAGFVFN